MSEEAETFKHFIVIPVRYGIHGSSVGIATVYGVTTEGPDVRVLLG
jgi:hypothetical protein